MFYFMNTSCAGDKKKVENDQKSILTSFWVHAKPKRWSKYTTHTHTHTNTHFKVDSIQKELENVKQELGALISVSFQSSVFSEIFQRLCKFTIRYSGCCTQTQRKKLSRHIFYFHILKCF